MERREDKKNKKKGCATFPRPNQNPSTKIKINYEEKRRESVSQSVFEETKKERKTYK
jgi:hypothetical protein